MSTLKSPDEAVIPKIFALPDEIFCKILGFSARSLMCIAVSKEVRRKIERSKGAKLAVSLKITREMTENKLVYFDRLATLFEVSVPKGLKYGELSL